MRRVPDWLLIYVVVLACLGVLVLVGYWLVDNGMEGGSLAEWFAAVGTIAAVGIAVVMAYSERDHHRRRESFLEAAMVVVDIDIRSDDGKLPVPAGKSALAAVGIVSPFGTAPVRNVRATMTWSNGQPGADRRGHVEGSTVEFQVRHIVPGTSATWPVTVAWPQGDPTPELESWVVTWVDRWGQWWESSLGASRPEGIGPLEPVSPTWPQTT